MDSASIPVEDGAAAPPTGDLSPRNLPQTKEGWLEKKGAVNKNWRERWFVLQNGLLEYYVDKEVRTIKAETTQFEDVPFPRHILTHEFSDFGVLCNRN